MKILFLSLAITANLTGVFWVSDVSAKEPWPRFRSQSGWSVQYPSSWEVGAQTLKGQPLNPKKADTVLFKQVGKAEQSTDAAFMEVSRSADLKEMQNHYSLSDPKSRGKGSFYRISDTSAFLDCDGSVWQFVGQPMNSAEALQVYEQMFSSVDCK